MAMVPSASNECIVSVSQLCTTEMPVFCGWQIEGFSLEFSEPGEPGIGFETEISLRLWAAQWQSGILDCGAMRRGVGGHGTLRSEEKHALRKAVWAANQQRMNSSFPLDFRRQLSAQVGVRSIRINHAPHCAA